MNCYSMTTRWEFGHQVEEPRLCTSGWQSTTRMPMTTCMLAWHSTIRTSMTSSKVHVCEDEDTTTLSERMRTTLSGSGSSCALCEVPRQLGSSMSLSCHLHVHGHLCGLFTLIFPFYFLLYLPHHFLFLNYMKSVVNLHNSCNEGVDSSDDLLLSTGYEPKAHDFCETTVESYVQLLDSPPLFSNKVSSADPDYDDATLEDMLHQVHRAQVDHSLREDLSISLSSSSMSDRTGQLVGDRSGQTGEHRSSEAQIRTLLDDQKEQILAECQARIGQHELQAVRAEEEQRLVRGQPFQQKLDFREAHQRSLTEMKELSKFLSSAFDTMARRKFIEDQIGTFWPSTGIAKWNKLYERFKGFSGCWINTQGRFPRYKSTSVIPTSSNFWRIAETFFVKHLGHTWYIGKRFCKSICIFISSLSRIASMGFIDRTAAPFIHSGEKWKAKTRSRSEMPVWTVSQRFSHPQWRRLFKGLWSRQTKSAELGSSFRQIPFTSHVCLLENKIQDRGMYLFTIPHGSYAMDQRSGDGWFSGWIEIFVINKKYFTAKFWSTWCEDCFSIELNHS